MIAGRSPHRCAAMAIPVVVVPPSRAAAAAIRRYLSGRSGANSPARANVASIEPARNQSGATRSAQDREAAFIGELVQRVLHDRAHVGVDDVDVGVLAELG